MLIDSIQIDSEFLPQIVIADPLAKGEPNFFLSLLKPKITVMVAGSPVVSAPWGEPEDYWPIVKFCLIVLFVIIAIDFLRK